MNKIYGMFGREEDASRVYLTLDENLSVISLSEAAKKAITKDVTAFPITKYVAPRDVYRLECFVRGDEKAKDISELGISLLDLNGFTFARVTRDEMFGSFVWKVYLFHSRKDFLKSVHTVYEQFELSRELHSLFDNVDRVRTVLESAEMKRNRDSEELGRMFSQICRHAAASMILQNLETCSEYDSVFDICAVIDMATRNAQGAFQPSVIFSDAVRSQRCSPISISAEELIYLVTALYCAMAQCHPSLLADLSEAGELLLNLTGDCSVLCRGAVCSAKQCVLFPDGAGFSDMTGLTNEDNAFCLYLCDVICTGGGYNVSVAAENGKLSLQIVIPPIRSVAEFKSRDLCEVSPIHLRLCSEAILSRVSERRTKAQG